MREECGGGMGARFKSGYGSRSGSVENINDPDPAKRMRILRIRIPNSTVLYDDVGGGDLGEGL